MNRRVHQSHRPLGLPMSVECRRASYQRLTRGLKGTLANELVWPVGCFYPDIRNTKAGPKGGTDDEELPSSVVPAAVRLPGLGLVLRGPSSRSLTAGSETLNKLP